MGPVHWHLLTLSGKIARVIRAVGAMVWLPALLIVILLDEMLRWWQRLRKKTREEAND